MYDFEYVRPASLADAAARMATSPEARLMSGGMTLIPTLKQRLAQPTQLIDISGLADLAGITHASGMLTMAVPIAKVKASETSVRVQPYSAQTAVRKIPKVLTSSDPK